MLEGALPAAAHHQLGAATGHAGRRRPVDAGARADAHRRRHRRHRSRRRRRDAALASRRRPVALTFTRWWTQYTFCFSSYRSSFVKTCNKSRTGRQPADWTNKNQSEDEVWRVARYFSSCIGVGSFQEDGWDGGGGEWDGRVIGWEVSVCSASCADALRCAAGGWCRSGPLRRPSPGRCLFPRKNAKDTFQSNGLGVVEIRRYREKVTAAEWRIEWYGKGRRHRRDRRRRGCRPVRATWAPAQQSPPALRRWRAAAAASAAAPPDCASCRCRASCPADQKVMWRWPQVQRSTDFGGQSGANLSTTKKRPP